MRGCTTIFGTSISYFSVNTMQMGKPDVAAIASIFAGALKVFKGGAKLIAGGIKALINSILLGFDAGILSEVIGWVINKVMCKAIF